MKAIGWMGQGGQIEGGKNCLRALYFVYNFDHMATLKGKGGAVERQPAFLSISVRPSASVLSYRNSTDDRERGSCMRVILPDESQLSRFCYTYATYTRILPNMP